MFGVYFSSAIVSTPNANGQTNIPAPMILIDGATNIAPKVRAEFRPTAGQTVASGASPSVPIHFDVEYDTSGTLAPVLDADDPAIRILKTGRYRIVTRANFLAGSSTGGPLGMVLVKNAIDPDGLLDADVKNLAALATDDFTSRIVGDFNLEEDDLIYVYVYNNTGASQDVILGTPPYNGHVIASIQISEI